MGSGDGEWGFICPLGECEMTAEYDEEWFTFYTIQEAKIEGRIRKIKQYLFGLFSDVISYE